MPAGTHADRNLTQVEAGKRKGVQQLAARATVIAFGEAGVFTVVVARRAGTGERTWVVNIAGAGFDISVFICLVVPASAADAKAVVLLVRDLHFAHQIDTIGHHIAPIKLGVGLVVAGVIGQRGVAPLGPYAQVVTYGVVPARGPVRIAGIKLGGLHSANSQGTPGHAEPDSQA